MMTDLERRALELVMTFSDTVHATPELEEVLRNSGGDDGNVELIILPLFDKELMDYLLGLAAKPPPSDIALRVVVEVDGSLENMRVVRSSLWHKDESGGVTPVQA